MSDEVFLSRQSWSELSDVGARHLDAAALQFIDISLAMPVFGDQAFPCCVAQWFSNLARWHR